MGKRNFVVIIIALIMFLGIMYLAYTQSMEIYKGFLSFGYYETNGMINSSKIVSEFDPEVGDSDTINRNKINYIYHVNGVEYIGKKISYSNSMNSDSRTYISSERMNYILYLEKYQEDKDVIVYYDPNDPHESVLEKKVPISSFGMLILFLFLAYIFGSALINMIFNKKVIK